jgi:two-component system, OmpR family, KDP operon response regulator KdpE
VAEEIAGIVPIGAHDIEHPASRRVKLRYRHRFVIGDRRIDLDAHTISVGGAQVHLTQIECRLLEHLGARLNQTVPSRKMVDLMWGRNSGRGLHSLRSVVKNIRRKLEPDPGRPRYLVLDRTLGYRLQSP